MARHLLSLAVALGVTGCAAQQQRPDKPNMACQYVGCMVTQDGRQEHYSPLEMTLEACLVGVDTTVRKLRQGDKSLFVAAAYLGECPSGIDTHKEEL